MIEVYGSARSRAFRVLWALEELGLPYTHAAESPRSEAVRALSPLGKVPVVRTEGRVLTDSSAILTWLADSTGRLTHPAGSLDRARQDALFFRLLDEVDGALWTAARHSFVLPEERRVEAVKPVARWEAAEALARLAPEIGAPHVLGGDFTIADILLTHCLDWAGSAKVDPIPEPLIAYRDRMRARPAYQRARAL